MKRKYAHSFWVRVTLLACLAGITYSSWPLGYILNPSVNSTQLASALEGLHQPFNWVFISGDIISSLLMLVVSWLLWRHYRNKYKNYFLNFVLINLIIFALGTIIDTLLPESCLPGAASCLSWRHNPILLAHGIFSILASFCLFLALLFIWWKNRTLIFTALMIGYIVFGLLSLYEAVGPTQSNFSQHYYISLCSLGMALIPYGVDLAFRGGEPGGTWKKVQLLKLRRQKALGMNKA